MKKIIILLLLFAACKSGSRTYVNHTEGQYAIADDTLVFDDTLIINRSGYRKIRDGDTLTKQYKIKQWGPHTPDALILRFEGKRAYWNNTIYIQLP